MQTAKISKLSKATQAEDCPPSASLGAVSAVGYRSLCISNCRISTETGSIDNLAVGTSSPLTFATVRRVCWTEWWLILQDRTSHDSQSQSLLLIATEWDGTYG